MRLRLLVSLAAVWWVLCTECPGQVTLRASLSSSGVQGDATSRGASSLHDGRHVAFVSDASGLVGGDTNGARDVFLRDLLRLRTIRISVSSDGEQGNANSYDPSISLDATRIAFESLASNLVSADGNGLRDIFVHDRQSGTTARASVSSGGDEADGSSFAPCLAADGSAVAFRSSATNLVPADGNRMIDIFIRLLDTGVTLRASLSSAGAEADGHSNTPALSADGRILAFESQATNLVVGDGNEVVDIFVRDLDAGVTTRVSVSSTGAEANGLSRAPSISADGRYVAFESEATNLAADDTNGVRDIFVHDRWTGTTIRASLASDAGQANGACRQASLASGGERVAFASDASNLVTSDANGLPDIFVRDLAAETTSLASVDSSGLQGNGESARPAMSADGRIVAFDSLASNLEPGDTNAVSDLFVRDTASDIAILCRPGNVNAGAGVITDVLFANGSPGHGPERALVLALTDALEIYMAAPPSKPEGPSRFALYAWFGPPSWLTPRTLPFDLGMTCMPMPLSGDGPPNPRQIWNNIGKTAHLGEPTLPSSPAPSIVISKPGGAGSSASVVLQGIILDSGAPQGQAGVTNAVVLVFTHD